MRTATAKLLFSLSAALCALTYSLPAAAQGYPGQPGPQGRNPACMRLEAQLVALDRGGADPARAEQIRRYEDASNKQQFELDQVVVQSRRMGCQGSGFFSLFGGQSAQCGGVNRQIQEMRANLDGILQNLAQLQGGTAGREGQRRAILLALGQNDCGPQYRSAATEPRGFFDSLFGPGSILGPSGPYQSSSFRTVCVRTCDGYYFPISYSATPSNFAEDEQACRRLCPAAEVQLYTHRNPGEEMEQAVSVGGQPYTALPNAFRYRKEVNSACSCKRPGQTWADALKQLDDNTIVYGDIVVTDENAKQLSRPKLDAKGKPQRPDSRSGKPDPKAAAAADSDSAPQSTPGDKTTAAPAPGKRQVRTVGPTFYPVR